jgi:DNA repair protein RecO (recombination protein O)
MPQHMTQAIVLHAIDYAESDRIVSLYSLDFGKLRGIAKGAKKSLRRFGSSLELFTCNEVTFSDRETHGLVRLERCRILRAYPEIACDVKRLVLGSYLLELVDTLTAEKQHHPEIFDLLLFFIDLLTGREFREELLRLFELRLFGYLGYQPQFQHCALCREPFDVQGVYGFSIQRGGIVCPRCTGQAAELLPLSNGTIRLLQQAQGLEFAKLQRLYFSQVARDESRRIFGRFLEFHIGHRPRSLEIMGQLS